MTTYISSLIEPVFRHARRFSRSSTSADHGQLDQENTHSSLIPTDDVSDENSSTPSAQEERSFSRRVAQDAALDRVLLSDDNNETVNELNSMSSTNPPPEADLRRLDAQRLQRVQEGSHGSTDRSLAGSNDVRARGRTDPLPRQPHQRAPHHRQVSWQTEDHRPRSRTLAGRTISDMVNGSGFVNDPVASQSVPRSIDGFSSSRPSLMSADSGTPMSSTPGVDVSKSLPEDDGMKLVRERIRSVQALDVSIEEKSRLMHAIMTERWMAGRAPHRDLLKEEDLNRPLSPATASLRSQDVPTTPRSSSSFTDGLNGLGASLFSSPQTSVLTDPGEDECNVTLEDLKPTYWVDSRAFEAGEHSKENRPDIVFGDEDLMDQNDDEERHFGCAHYKRNVKLRCADCYRWYTCRFCHDAVETHTLVRHRTRHMLCMICGTAQPAGKSCRKCHEVAASYYCDICKLWDDDITRKIYHCSACGICRRGEGLGKDFYHCPTCDVCIEMKTRDTHRCIERSVDCDCPICGDYMFNSPTTVVFLRCGHGIHHTCYKRHLESNYRCPICAKSIINMEMSFRNLDRAIQAQPMPEHFRGTRAIVYCNDCRTKTSVPYHWLGLKCGECDSYNTAKVSILGPEETSESNNVGTIGTGGNGHASNQGDNNDVLSRNSSYALTNRFREGGSNDTLIRRPTSTGGIQDPRPSPGSEEFYPLTTPSASRPMSAIGLDRFRLDPETAAAAASGGGGSGGDLIGARDGNGQLCSSASAVSPQLVREEHEYETEDEDEEDELDFWGGEDHHSPRRVRSRTSAANLAATDANNDRIARGQDDEYDSDSSSYDDGVNDEAGDDDDEDENDLDELELPGHR